MSVTLLIVIVTVAISLLCFNNAEYQNKFKLNPYMVRHKGEWIRLIMHGFVHADYIHLGFNMFVLYSFGNQLEEALAIQFPRFPSTVIYLVLYFLGLLVATLPALYKHSNNHGYNAVGASGAVSAVVFALILLFPLSELRLFPIPIALKAFIFGFLYLLGEQVMSRRGGTRIAHDAHLAGALLGIVFLVVLDYNIFSNFLTQIGDWFQSFF